MAKIIGRKPIELKLSDQLNGYIPVFDSSSRLWTTIDKEDLTSGSAITSGSNTFIGNQIISGSVIISDSLEINGRNYINDSSSFESRINTNSSSFANFSGSYINESSSFADKIRVNSSSFADFSGSYVNESSSFADRIRVNSSSFTNFSGSYINESASFASRITINSSSFILFSGSYINDSSSFADRITTNSSSFALFSGSYINDSASFDFRINNVSSSLGSLSSSLDLFSGSFNTGSFTGSFTGSLIGTASYATQALTASNANTASSADDFIVRGTLTAQTINVQTITSSVDFVTGSSINGSLLTNTHQFTGSVDITGSLTVNGSDYITTSGSTSTRLTNLEVFSGSYSTGSFTGSFIGRVTGSFSGSLSNLQNTVLGHIPFFSSSQVLADSVIRQLDNGSGSFSIAINQDNITTAAPEALYVSQPSSTSYNVIAGKGNLNNYLQLNIQNTNTGVNASSDVVATANNGDETSNYIDMGINSEGFTGSIGNENDAYLYSTGKHLHIGTATNYPIQFFAGGIDTDANRKFQLNPNNLHELTGSLSITEKLNVIGGVTASLQGTASWANNAITASYAIQALSASYWSGSIINAATASYVETAQTASYVLNAVSSSYASTASVAISALVAEVAQTASYVVQAQSASYWSGSIINAESASFATTASYALFVDGISNGTASIADTASFVQNAQSASYVLNAVSASYWSGSIINAESASYTVQAESASYWSGSIINAATASYVETAQTASYVLNAITASYIQTAQTASYVLQAVSASYATSASFVAGISDGTASLANTASYAISASYAATASSADDFTVRGTLTAQTINVQTITSSVDFVTGSSVNGSLLTNTHQFTGSVSVTGSLTVNDSEVILTNQTSSMSVATASFVSNAVSSSFASTSSYVLNAVSASFATLAQTANTASFVQTAQTASYVLNAVSASFASTASFVQTAQTASYVLNALSASFASTASSVNRLNQNVVISGSLTVTGSTNIIGNSGTTLLSSNADTLIFTGSLFTTGSIVSTGSLNILGGITGSLLGTASYATQALSASYWSGSIINAATASYVLNAISASHSATASSADNFLVRGTLTAQTINVQTITSSIEFNTGSTRNGTLLTNTHQFTGSVSVTGSLGINGVDYNLTSASFDTRIINTSSSLSTLSSSYLASSASFDTRINANSSSIAQLSGSYLADSSSFATRIINNSASIAQLSSSYLASSASFDTRINIISSSYATTGSNVFKGNQTITGSFTVSGSTLQIGNNTLLGNTTLSGSIIITGSVNAQSDINLGGLLRLDPAIDPGASNLTASFLFTSASNTATGFDLYYRQNGNLVKFKWIEGMLNTGILYGGILTYSASNFYISSGSGIIVNHDATAGSEISPTITYVNWAASTHSISNPSAQNTYVFIDANGDLQQQNVFFTPEQYHDLLPIGRISHYGATGSLVTGVGNNILTTYDLPQQLGQFTRAFGPLKISGFTITPQVGNLSLNIGSGTAFNLGGYYQNAPDLPSTYNSNTYLTSSIIRLYRSGSGFQFDNNGGSYYTTVNPLVYDDGTGTLATVGNGNWSIQRVFVNPITGRSHVYYGQSTYPNYLNAVQSVATDDFVESEVTKNAYVFAGYLVMQGGASNNDLSVGNTTNAIIQAGLFRNSVGGSGGATTAVSDLNDLSDVNISSPSNGQALIYSAGTWINGTPISSSYAATASFVNGVSNGTASFANTASFVILAQTASFVQTAQTASYILNAISASHALTASSADNFLVRGTLTAQTINVQTITSSIEFNTGSTRNGSILSNTHQFTGSVSVTGSLAVNNFNVILTNQTSSMSVATASYVLNAVSSSFATLAQTANTASFVQTAQTASYVLNAVSSSFATLAQTANTASFVTLAQTASFVQTAQTASYVLNAVSSSFATLAQTANTASFVVLAQTASYVLNAVSASRAVSAAQADSATTASYVLNAVSSSFASLAQTANTASFVQTAQTASYVLNAVSSSFAATASSADNFTVRGTLTAQNIVVQTITSSIEFNTGSTRNGSLLTNTHEFTGSVLMTGSLDIAGNITNKNTNLVYSIGGANSDYNTVWTGTVRGTGLLTLRGGSGTEIWGAGRTAIRANPTTNNITIQNGGTYTDNGYNLQVNGSGSLSGSLFVSGSSLFNGTATIVSASLNYQQNLAVATGSFQTIVSATTGSFRSAFFDYVAFSGSVVRAGIIVSTWSGSNTEFYENFTEDLGGSTSLVNLRTVISSGNIVLQAGISGSAWSVRSLVRLL